MDHFFDDISRAYQQGITAPGKELHFVVLVAFLLAFGFIRTSAHMIRAQVSWWPGNLATSESTAVLGSVQLLGVLLALVCLAKGKRFAAIVGVFVPAVALVGAWRLAKPGSRWARRRYAGAKLERARARFANDPDQPLSPVPATGSTAG